MKAKNNVVTILLIAVNVIIFLIEEVSGGSNDVQVALRFGAEYVPLIQAGEYYRLFTACFLHFGFYHLISNMFSLYLMGRIVEQVFGKVRYLIIYLVSGITGNVLTFFLEVSTGSYSVSAGASGAIFGLFGTFAVMAISRKFRVASLWQVILAIVLSLSPGFSDPEIGVSAHIGGLIGGFIISLILLPTLRAGGRRR